MKGITILSLVCVVFVAVLSQPVTAGKRGFRCFHRLETHSGDSLPNVILGGLGNDVMVGRGGGDRLNGLSGRDRICGGGGDDTLVGGDGFDRINGGPGFDQCMGDFEKNCEA